MNMQANFGNYDQKGYFQMFFPNTTLEQYQKTIGDLLSEEFINLETIAIVSQFTLYYPNRDYFVSVSLVT